MQGQKEHSRDPKKARGVDSVLHCKAEGAKAQRIEMKNFFCFYHEQPSLGILQYLDVHLLRKKQKSPKHPDVPSDRAIASGPEYDTRLIVITPQLTTVSTSPYCLPDLHFHFCGTCRFAVGN